MSLRVIAGTRRSRRLKAPSGARTRPTSARVREAVFAILGDVSDARVLDVYAGSGALGIEALSRGAAHATFVEADRAALAVIRGNLHELELESCATVVATRVEAARALLVPRAPFDLILCDPPWADLPRAAEALARLIPLFAPQARVVFEHPRAGELSLPDLIVSDRRTWGDTGVSFFSMPNRGLGSSPELDPSADAG